MKDIILPTFRYGVGHVIDMIGVISPILFYQKRHILQVFRDGTIMCRSQLTWEYMYFVC